MTRLGSSESSSLDSVPDESVEEEWLELLELESVVFLPVCPCNSNFANIAAVAVTPLWSRVKTSTVPQDIPGSSSSSSPSKTANLRRHSF